MSGMPLCWGALMTSDKEYSRLLKRMFIIEVIGEVFYDTLNSKVADAELEAVYGQLALNEKATAGSIKTEMSRLGKYPNMVTVSMTSGIARLIFRLFTAEQLLKILKKVLERRVYSDWYRVYGHNNRDFWRFLLDHENLQHELLGKLWNKI